MHLQSFQFCYGIRSFRFYQHNADIYKSFPLCKLFLSPSTDKNSKLLKWINGVSTTAASNVCMAVLKWEGSHLLRGVCTLWCVKTAPTIIWWFIVIPPVWASALFSDLYLPAPRGSFLLCILCLRFVTATKELSNSLICFRNVNQEALTTVKTLMSSPPEQTLPSVSHPSHFQKLIWLVFSSVQENRSD